MLEFKETSMWFTELFKKIKLLIKPVRNRYFKIFKN